MAVNSQDTTLFASGSDDRHDLQAPCTYSCPIHTDAQGYVNAIARGDFDGALDIIRLTNPLAWSLGAICPHPCETECRRGQVEESISICNLKRAAAEYSSERPPLSPEIERSENVAIIGAGPAGLTAALVLRQQGYGVTVIDCNPSAGGTLLTGVPTYRLPRQALLSDSDYLTRSGVEFRFSTRVVAPSDLSDNDSEGSGAITLESLIGEGFSAVILATGLGASRNLNITNIDSPGVILALPFLRQTNDTSKFADIEGREVVVIGGGSVATDVARSAIRAGARVVKLACLESRAEMPAQPWEVLTTIEEGCDLNCSLGPQEILVEGEESRIIGVRFKAVQSVFDSNRRFNPTFYDDRDLTLTCDRVIVAIGQGAELGYLAESGVRADERGRITLDPKTWMTTRAGVFATGDFAKGPGAAVYSMANAQAVARQVHSYIQKVGAVDPPEIRAVVRLESGTVERIPRLARFEPAMPTVEARLAEFSLPEPSLSREAAIAESQRCLNCATGAQITVARCAECLTCLRICPYGVPRIEDGRLVIPFDQCQSCSICSQECPAQVIRLRREVDISALIRSSLAYVPRDAAPIVLVAACQYSPDARALADTPGFRIPEANVQVMPVMCVGRLSQAHYLQALELGAKAVIALSCEDEHCRFLQGGFRAEERIARVQKLLAEIGMPTDSVSLLRLSTAENGESSSVTLRSLLTERAKEIASR